MKLIYNEGLLHLTEGDNPDLEIICDSDVYLHDGHVKLGSNYRLLEVTAFADTQAMIDKPQSIQTQGNG